MSELHVRQIKAALHQHFDDLIDISDYDSKSAEETESAFLSRSQGAFALSYLTGESPANVAESVTDGGGDNGLDLVHYSSTERVLYLVQSKWKSSGRGSLSRGDTQKFIKGFRDLINARWGRFNDKIQSIAPAVEGALNDASTKIALVACYTGQSPLSSEVAQDLKDTIDEVNDPADIVSLQVLKQGDIYSAVSQGVEGNPIDLDLALYDWGQVRDPYTAYYGQVAASDIAEWFTQHQGRLFDPNIRMFLGSTDVNTSMVTTLMESPSNFWYFNNGITALCRSIIKKPIGGATKETGIFECRDLRIVNGAQTVGAISNAFEKDASSVESARVTIRIIALEECPPDFGRQITRYNNTQNRIDRRDFVSLDPQQERLRGELQLEGIQYVYKSGDTVGSSASGFDLTEATVARACVQEDVRLAVQAKREIGKLWEEINTTPYKILFNDSIQGPRVWREVQIIRAVEKALSQYRNDEDGRRRLLSIHGNRFIAHMVMLIADSINVNSLQAINEQEEKDVISLTTDVYNQTLDIVNDEYPDGYLASLFKNITKCKHVKTKLLSI